MPDGDEQIINDIFGNVIQENVNLPRRINARIGNGGNNLSGLVLNTVGLELESVGKSRDEVSRILNNIPRGFGDNFTVHRDGSSEMNVYKIATANGSVLAFNSHTKAARQLFSGGARASTLGYELISVPMNIEIAELSIRALLPKLRNSGDFISERCATHIHVGGMKNLEFLKNCLRIGLWADDLFFALAAMGQDKFRGYSNNAIYARPLSNGPYISYNRNYYQILNWKKALDATDIYKFFTCYGLELGGGELPKYHPGRYFSLNLYSVPRIGTLEFRYFNQSFDDNLVVAVTKLCQLFTEIAIKARKRDISKLEVADVFYTYSTGYYLEKLYTLLGMGRENDCTYSLNSKDIYFLEKAISRYKGIGIENKPVMTHCREVNINDDTISQGHLIASRVKPVPDGHTDIRNIEYYSIMGK